MDEVNDMLIRLTESRRKVAVSMLNANAANELPLTEDEIARCEADIAACDAELAELRNG
jgi:hypothetical protein